MSQQQRPFQLAWLGALLLSLLAGIYLFAWKRLLKLRRSRKVVKHSVETSPDEALQYWTEDKMRSARGVDLPTTDDLHQEKKRPQRSPRTSE